MRFRIRVVDEVFPGGWSPSKVSEGVIWGAVVKGDDEYHLSYGGGRAGIEHFFAV